MSATSCSSRGRGSVASSSRTPSVVVPLRTGTATSACRSSSRAASSRARRSSAATSSIHITSPVRQALAGMLSLPPTNRSWAAAPPPAAGPPAPGGLFAPPPAHPLGGRPPPGDGAARGGRPARPQPQATAGLVHAPVGAEVPSEALPERAQQPGERLLGGGRL